MMMKNSTQIKLETGGLLLGSFVFSFVIIELILRAVGFSYALSLEKVMFNDKYASYVKKNYLIDKDLLWVPENYFEKLNISLINNPAIVFMGCSCTEFGRYDQFFSEIVLEEFPLNKVSYINLGVSGWSSYQGLQQLKRDVLKVKPKVVTIFYGWNDHWTGFGIEDKEVSKINSSIVFNFQKLRLGQLILKAYIGLLHNKRFSERVSAADFRKNISEMVKTAKDNQITPVLLTAPSAHQKGNEPAYLEGIWLRNLDDLIPLHQKYIAIIRDIAKDEDVILCDLARKFKDLPYAETANRYFMKDGIHPTDEGSKKIAEFLYDCFKHNDLLIKIIT